MQGLSVEKTSYVLGSEIWEQNLVKEFIVNVWGRKETKILWQ